MALIEQEFVALTQDLDVQAFWQENARCQQCSRIARRRHGRGTYAVVREGGAR